MLDPCYFENGTVDNEDYCELLEIFSRSEVDCFAGNSLFQQYGALRYINLDARIPLADVVLAEIGKYRRTNRGLDLLILQHSCFSCKNL